MKTLSFVLGICVVLIALHFRLPKSVPTHPEPFDTDLIGLKIRQAPKNAKIVFLGDSITDRWEFHPEEWNKFGKAANLGIPGSRASNVLWLVKSKSLSVFNPEVFVVKVGANDLRPIPHFFERRMSSVPQVNSGIGLISESLHEQFPNATIIIMPSIVAKEELSGDGFHMNNTGYERWRELICAQAPNTCVSQ